MQTDEAIETAPVTEKPKAILEPHSGRRVKRIAEHTGATSYLEVGVFKGKTFNNVRFDRQVGVDPIFGFDCAEFARPGLDFVATTSDQYFVSENKGETFDIVFLDGLHTFQQTFRDFNNSLVCSNPKTVWLIDDVLPSDVYSSLPISSEARNFRKRAGGNSNAWHGDVYKLIYLIHDFFPTLSYLTFSTGGNPQGLIWQKPRASFSPIHKTVEAIERMSYFDMLKLENVLNLMPESQAFDHFFASLPGKCSPPAAPQDTPAAT